MSEIERYKMGNQPTLLKTRNDRRGTLFVLLTLVSLSQFACQSPEQVEFPLSSYENFGETISWEGAIPVATIMEAPAQYLGKEVKLEGVARKVCQKKGCWMTVDADPHGSIRVTFKDYGFFVPKDISGKTVIVEGIIDEANLSGEMKEHYRKEEGMSEEDASEVIEASENHAIVASGVIVETSLDSLQSSEISPPNGKELYLASNASLSKDQGLKTNNQATN